MQLISFASGSSGNCYYIHAEGCSLLVDLGLGIRIFKKIYKDYGCSFGDIQGILVTHNHTDHTKAVGYLSNEFHIPVYTTQAVHDGMKTNPFLSKKVRQEELKVIIHNESFRIGPFTITSFAVPHDSFGNNGFFIEYEDISLCIITDIGHVTPEICDFIKKSTHLIVEANYDTKMLESGPYPLHLKRRIQGPYGHISNAETAKLLSSSLTPNLIKKVWLCHLSEENNTPDIAANTCREILQSIPNLQHITPIPLPRRTPTWLIDIR